MLVLSRKEGQAIVIDGDIKITLIAIRGNQVRIGIDAPSSVQVLREELCAALPACTKNGPMPAPSVGR